MVNQLNFHRGCILPLMTYNASASADLYKREKLSVRLQADGENLSNKIQVIDFGGLFQATPSPRRAQRIPSSHTTF